MTTMHCPDGHVDDVPNLTWLEGAACAHLGPGQLHLFFVEAGHVISPATMAMCERCPVRRACLEHAYRLEITSGYFGGMSPGRRRVLSVEEAIAEIGC